MEEMVDAGFVRSIGLKDASVEALSDIMEVARIQPVVNSLGVHPGHRNDELIHFGRSQVSLHGKQLHTVADFYNLGSC